MVWNAKNWLFLEYKIPTDCNFSNIDEYGYTWHFPTSVELLLHYSGRKEAKTTKKGHFVQFENIWTGPIFWKRYSVVTDHINQHQMSNFSYRKGNTLHHRQKMAILGHFLVVFLNSKQLWLAWFFLYFKLLSQMTFFKINWVLDALVKHLSSKNDQKQPFLAIFWILSYVKPADFKKMQQYDYVSHLST